MEGGIGYLRDVIVHDRLGIADELERQMQSLVDSYECEWKAVVNDPEKRKFFRQFANTDEVEPGIEFVTERGQKHPAPWPSDFVAIDHLLGSMPPTDEPESTCEPLTEWVHVGSVEDFPLDGGRAIEYGATQIAVFRFESRNEWYATENTCPHKREAVLSRGIIGDQRGDPKVACPLHKKTFSLQSGNCLSGENYRVQVFPVRVDGDEVFVQLPAPDDFSFPVVTSDVCDLAAAYM